LYPIESKNKKIINSKNKKIQMKTRKIVGVDPVFAKYLESAKKDYDPFLKSNNAFKQKLADEDFKKYYAAKFPDLHNANDLLSNRPSIPAVFVKNTTGDDVGVLLMQFLKKFLDVPSTQEILNDLSLEEQTVIYYFRKKFEEEIHNTFSMREPISYDAFLLFSKRFAREFGGVSLKPGSSKGPPKTPPTTRTTAQTPITPKKSVFTPGDISNSDNEIESKKQSLIDLVSAYVSPEREPMKTPTLFSEVPSLYKVSQQGIPAQKQTIDHYKFIAKEANNTFDSYYGQQNNKNDKLHDIWQIWKGVFQNPKQIETGEINLLNFKKVYSSLKNALPSDVQTSIPSVTISRNWTKGKGIVKDRDKDPRIGIIFTGRGVSLPKKEKTHNYHKKNGFMVDLDQLNKNQLIVKKDNGQHRYGPHFISDKTKRIILNFLQNETIDEEVYEKLSLVDKVPLFFINYYLKISNEMPDLRADLREQFSVLKGSVEAGNNNPLLLHQTKLILALMVETKMITKNTMLSMLHDVII
jgi:hypothetical protein